MEPIDKYGAEAPSGKRQYVRASDNIPVYYETAEEADVQTHETPVWESFFDEIEPSPEENPRLYELLFDINQKLNLLITHLAGKNGFNLPDARNVDISGGGVKFLSRQSFKEGEGLVLKMFLPTSAHVLRIKCEVLRCDRREGGAYEIAVKYADLDEGTRDKIIRYVFARQRRNLRSSK